MRITENFSILFIDHVSDIGGAERSLIDLSRTLSSQGIICNFIIPGNGPLGVVLREIGPVHSVPIQSWRWWVRNPFKLLLSLPKQILVILKIIALIKKIKPDLVHFNINRLVEPLFAVALTRRKSIMHYRDIPSRIEKPFIFGLNFFFRVMNLSNVWIANSRATYNDIVPSAKVPVFHIPNGIDLVSFEKKRNLNIPIDLHGGHKVLMIASLTPWKNIEGYIRLAYETLHVPNVHFYVAGGGAIDYLKQLQAMTRDLRVDHRVTFLGEVEFIPALLNKVDILVHTTIDEPFGRVFVEAMLASKPIVTFNGGGADEIIDDGKTGFLVEPNAINRMAERLRTLLNNESLRERFGQAGFQKAVEYFSLEQHVSRILNVYKTLI